MKIKWWQFSERRYALTYLYNVVLSSDSFVSSLALPYTQQCDLAYKHKIFVLTSIAKTEIQ